MQAEYLWDPESVTEDEELPLLRTEKLLLNMGPQHPATHGVLQVILELEGSVSLYGSCTSGGAMNSNLSFWHVVMSSP